MILIADSGATKTSWCYVTSSGEEKYIYTPGVNPFHDSKDNLLNQLKEKLYPEVNDEIHYIYFYGAGCINANIGQFIESLLKELFPDAEIQANSDVLAAARATCKDSPGIAGILGTGSNSCLYDGKNIIDNIPPLGYILGDEGSGAVIGREIISRYFKRDLPGELKTKFETAFNPNQEEILNRIYKSATPSKYLAGYAKFVYDNLNHLYIYELAKAKFLEFFDKNISKYENSKDYMVSFIGSVAYYYKSVITEAANERGYKTGNILKAPIQGLRDYHKEKI